MSIVISPQYAKTKQIFTITAPLKCKKDSSTPVPFTQCKGFGCGQKGGIHFDQAGDYKVITTISLDEADDDVGFVLEYDDVSAKSLQLLEEEDVPYSPLHKNGYRWTECYHVFQPLSEVTLLLKDPDLDMTILNASMMIEYVD